MELQNTYTQFNNDDQYNRRVYVNFILNEDASKKNVLALVMPGAGLTVASPARPNTDNVRALTFGRPEVAVMVTVNA